MGRVLARIAAVAAAAAVLVGLTWGVASSTVRMQDAAGVPAGVEPVSVPGTDPADPAPVPVPTESAPPVESPAPAQPAPVQPAPVAPAPPADDDDDDDGVEEPDDD